jgi:hypothetical protein
MIDLHKELIKWFKKEFGISDYGILWICFMEGFIIGGLIVYFLK